MSIRSELRDHADYGFERVASGGTSSGGPFYAVKAIGGSLTFGACVMNAGSAPTSGDILLEGDVLHAPFKTVISTSGVVYCFNDEPQ